MRHENRIPGAEYQKVQGTRFKVQEKPCAIELAL